MRNKLRINNYLYRRFFTNTIYHIMNILHKKLSGKVRLEHDLLGERDIPDEYYFGIQTLRAVENFSISGTFLNQFPEIIQGMAMVKEAAALANFDLGYLSKEVKDAIVKACKEIKSGKLHEHFVVDPVQGGAGTSVNMNANEVIANRALELLGHKKGEYQYCHPNNHINLAQSTNDAFPTGVKIAIINANKSLVEALSKLSEAVSEKASEFTNVLKMGRTQLQDAVPMTLEQEFKSYADMLNKEIQGLTSAANAFASINMGATAIGTGINSDPEYASLVTGHLVNISGLSLEKAKNLVEATQDTTAYVTYSSALKRLAVKLSKICNDLRLLSSGPRTGIGEINLPPMQPGSSIMPGKVNPVIPEVVNQIAFKVIGNDTTITIAAEASQLELNVMEPVMVQTIFESLNWLKNGMDCLREKCIIGITANRQHCMNLVLNSIGLVTALNPYIGYEASSEIAKEAMATGKGVYELVLEKNLLSKEELSDILAPSNMIKPRKFKK